MDEKLKVGSLFSGIGGFEKGFEDTGGFETVWQCEIEPYARSILAKHWPDVRRYDDITKLCQDDSTSPEYVDVICGGFPCPAFSRAGKQGGFEQDPLFYDMLRVCRYMHPKYIVFENVEGFTKFKEELRKQVEDIGYEWCDALLDARDFGVPQARIRYFAICIRRGVLPSSQHIRGLQRDEGKDIRGLQSDTSNTEGRWTPTVSSKEEWRDIFANSRRGGKDHGLSRRLDKNRSDRLRCLGNAVVPAVAKHIGNTILEMERMC